MNAGDPCSDGRIGLAASGATVAGSRIAGLMALVARMKFLRRTGLDDTVLDFGRLGPPPCGLDDLPF